MLAARPLRHALLAATTLLVVLAGSAPSHAAVNLKRFGLPSLAKTATAPTPPSFPTSAKTPAPPDYVEGEAIVRFKRDVTKKTRERLHRKLGVTVLRPLLLPRTYLVAFSPTRHPRSVADQYERDPIIEYAEPNFILSRASTKFPIDQFFTEQWALHNRGQVINGTSGTDDADVDAPEAWDKETGAGGIDGGVVVGVVDTGIGFGSQVSQEFGHSDMRGVEWLNHGELGQDVNGDDKKTNCNDDDGSGREDDWRGFDFVDNYNPGNCVIGQDQAYSDPSDVHGHGTHVAGIIGARGNNPLGVGNLGVGVSGVAWRSQLAALRACGLRFCDAATLAEAFSYAGQVVLTSGRVGMHIVNASVGGPNPSTTLQTAMEESPNTLFVVAAGNGGDDEVGDDLDEQAEYPCATPVPNVICVGATDRNDELTTFSNHSDTHVDIAAPGQHVLSTWKPYQVGNFSVDQYAFVSGTSQAAPLVAGAAALVLSENRGLTPLQVKSAILDNADSVLDASKVAGGRRLNINAALSGPTEGELDADFGDGGRAQIDFGSSNDAARAVVVQSDGKIVVAGDNGSDITVARLTADGFPPDVTFSDDGQVTADADGSADRGHAVALQSDGKIVVAGRGAASGSARWALLRFNDDDGTLDTSFDGDGKVITDMGGSTVQEAFGVAVQSDGKIVAVGPGRVTGQSTNDDFVVARYNTDGTLDSSFGVGGRRATDFSTSFDSAKAVALQPDGKIVVVGGSGVGLAANQENWAIARYTSAGALDTTFSGDGKDTANVGGGSAPLDEAAQERASDVAILANGEIVVAGQSPADPPADPHRFHLRRYSATGSPAGSSSFTMQNYAALGGSALQVDGKIVSAGTSEPSGSRVLALVRNFTTGSMPADASFGRAGPPVFSSFPSNTVFCGPEAAAEDVALTPNGDLVVVGAVSGSAPCGNQVVARYDGGGPHLSVTPDFDLAAGGASITVSGGGFPASSTVAIEQCHGTAPTECTTLDASAAVDANGSFNQAETVQYATGTFDCDDPTCRIRIASPSFSPVEEAISFKKASSVSVTPSAGAVVQGESVEENTNGIADPGEEVTFTAEVKGLDGGTPTGDVSFWPCGPPTGLVGSEVQIINVFHPASCHGGPIGNTVGLVDAGGGRATATLPTQTFDAPGRYCFLAIYNGDSNYKESYDSSKTACISVREAPTSGPVAVDDAYLGSAGQPLTVAGFDNGLLQNDRPAGDGSAACQVGTCTAEQVTGPPCPAGAPNTTRPCYGDITGLDANGGFTYTPEASVDSDFFTYKVKDASNTPSERSAFVAFDLTADSLTSGSSFVGSRFHGSRFHGSRFHGSRFHASRFHGSRFHTGDQSLPELATYAECGPRWVWLNAVITIFEEQEITLTAALYDANGNRIADSGIIASGVFYGDITDPVDLAWPVWNTPVRAGGVYAQMLLKIDPTADSTEADAYTLPINTVGCIT